MIFNDYKLKDGRIYWHKLYFDLVPTWMTKCSPPFGDYNYAAYLYRPHRYFQALYNRVKWFVQRGRRGWSDSDVWAWFHQHSRIMVGVLQYIQKYRHGYPSKLTSSEWAKKLKAMEEGFRAAIDEQEDYTSYKRLSQKEYKKLILKRRQKIMLGLKYFREYYYNL